MVLGVLLAVAGEAVGSRSSGCLEGLAEEADGLDQAFVRFCTTEAEEAQAGRPEAFSAEAGDAEVVVGPFE